MSDFNATVLAAWPQFLATFGETITHEPDGATASYTTTLIFDGGSVIEQKGGRVAAAIKGPTTAFTTAPGERDTFTRGSEVYACVEVEDDKAGGYICWVRRKF